MLFIKETTKTEEVNTINNFFAEQYNEFETVNFIQEETPIETPVSKYVTALVSNQYQKSVEDIENTKIGNKRTIKRSLEQVMKESFFSGANRFGSNFIA